MQGKDLIQEIYAFIDEHKTANENISSFGRILLKLAGIQTSTHNSLLCSDLLSFILVHVTADTKEQHDTFYAFLADKCGHDKVITTKDIFSSIIRNANISINDNERWYIIRAEIAYEKLFPLFKAEFITEKQKTKAEAEYNASYYGRAAAVCNYVSSFFYASKPTTPAKPEEKISHSLTR